MLIPGVIHHYVFMMTLAKIGIYVVLRVWKRTSHAFPHWDLTMTPPDKLGRDITY